MGEGDSLIKGLLSTPNGIKEAHYNNTIRFWLIQSVKELVHPKIRKCNVVAKF